MRGQGGKGQIFMNERRSDDISTSLVLFYYCFRMTAFMGGIKLQGHK